jgi:hypothetical protein
MEETSARRMKIQMKEREKIKNLGGLSIEEIQEELLNGARFVVFEYCISLILVTFKRRSSIYFIPAGVSPWRKSIGFTLITILLGWWGIPWGPIYTVKALYINLRGGLDLTEDLMS